MPCLTRPDAAAQSPQRRWLGLALALLLVLAQALLLHHQVEHVGGDMGIGCPVCISGSSLDHAAVASPQAPPAAAVLRPASLALYAAPRLVATRHADARAPPSVRDA